MGNEAFEEEHRIRRETDPTYKKIDRGVHEPTTEKVGPLVYEGHVIRDRGEMMNLTDMWKAAGNLADRQPARWRRFDGTERFIQSLISKGIVSGEHNEVFQAVRGGKNPGTWAHWQIGLSYARYLSPEFEAWCNTVVRNHMDALARARTGKIEPERVATPRRGCVLTEADFHAIGSMDKAVTRWALKDEMPAILREERESYRQQIMADRNRQNAEHIDALEAQHQRHMAEIVAVLDARLPKAIGVPKTDTLSVHQMLTEQGFGRGECRGLGAHLSKMLHDGAKAEAAQGRPYPATKCPSSGHWLFDAGFAKRVVKGSAAPMIASHRARLHEKQGVLDFALARKPTKR